MYFVPEKIRLTRASCEGAPARGRRRGGAGEGADGDLAQVGGDHAVALPMACGIGEGKEDVFLRQERRRFRRADVVAHKDDGLRAAHAQGVHNGLQLGIPHGGEDHIVVRLRLQRGHHRKAAHRGAGRQLILDAQAVFLNFLRPASAGEKGDVFSGGRQIVGEIAAQHAGAEHQNFHNKIPLFYREK